LHNYGDVTRGRTSFTEAMLALVEGEVWVTETGGLVRQSDAGGVLRWPPDEERARAGMARAVALPRAHPHRLPRPYVYHWQPRTPTASRACPSTSGRRARGSRGTAD